MPPFDADRTPANAGSHDGRAVRAMLVDDHDVVRSGLRAMLEAGGIRVVAEAATEAGAMREAERARPDVVVMDVRLGNESGIEATREIRARLPATRVVMLTSYQDDDALVASLLAGASGYILKQVRGGDIVSAVKAVARGQNLFETAATDVVVDRLRTGKHRLEGKLALLSPKEESILEHIALGKTNAQIAAEMGLAEKTVKNYVSSLLTKLGVTGRAEAAAYLGSHSSRTD